MRTRHPFPDVQESELPATWLLTEEAYRASTETLLPAVQYAQLAAELEAPARGLRPSSGANRRQRRAGTAQFVGPKELGPGLRRDLLEQRQRRALGTLDVELRRLQRKQRKAKTK